MDITTNQDLCWRKVTNTRVKGSRSPLTISNIPRPGLTAHLVGSKVFTIGGSAGGAGNFISALHVLDLNTNEWTDYNLPAETARRDHVSFLWNDYLYVYSGWRDRVLTDLFRIDLLELRDAEFLECRWEGIEMLVFDYFSASLCETSEELVMFGGKMDGVLSSRTFCMRVRSNSFYEPQVKGQIPRPRSMQSSCAVKNKVYMYGGNSPALADFHVLTILPAQYVWSQLARAIGGCPTEPGIVGVGGGVIILGGNGRATRNFMVYSYKRKRYLSVGVRGASQFGDEIHDIFLDKFLPKIYSHAVVCTRDSLVVLGGYGADGRNYWTLQPRTT